MMRSLFLFLFLLLETGLAACMAPQNAASPIRAGLYVDATRELGKVSPYALGTNHGPWATITEDVQKEFLASGVTLIRFPGGNWGDQNYIEGWQFDLFIAQAKQVNAEPLISVRLRGGSVDYAVSLVKYARGNNYNVRYWSIGNEPSLYQDYDTEKYNADWRKFALAMKAADPSILLVGPDTNQFTGDPKIDPKDSQGRDWLIEFLRANGDLVDVVAVHRYPFPINKGERPTRADLVANTVEWDAIITHLRQAVREHAKRDLPIAITEFNSSWVGTMGSETSLDSFANALWLADVLGRLIRARVDIVGQFTLQSGSDVGGYGLLARDAVRPSYYTYQMWKHFGDQLVDAASDNSQISIYAARKGETLTLMLVNLSDQPQTRPITLDHFTPTDKASVRLFDSTHNATEEAAASVSAKFQYTFPASSVTLLIIPGKVTR
ncbi:MAG: hypothetical protein HZB51_05230 [Chloroflexi bacterium]|nr:hypothetical protein [Chloroflexota bacterium]